ncbi:MAG: hypothetical protein KDD39_01975 [Bdellovibrionales bacterium]|nr:hypothetical protein [Bdellovibrionales bacterium]
MKWLDLGLVFIIIPLLTACGAGNKKNTNQPATGAGSPDRSLWHNWASVYDINQDGSVTARDILNILNTIHRDGERGLPKAAYHSEMYKYDTNLDGFVTIIDALLVAREYARIFNEHELPVYSQDVATRTYELSFDTAKLFYRLCRVEPVEEINGSRPGAGRRWFQTRTTHGDGTRVYFLVLPTGEMYRLTSDSLQNVDKFIAKLDMSLFDNTDDPFFDPHTSELSDNPYGCPKEEQ